MITLQLIGKQNLPIAGVFQQLKWQIQKKKQQPPKMKHMWLRKGHEHLSSTYQNLKLDNTKYICRVLGGP
jgi:hypothetical protein